VQGYKATAFSYQILSTSVVCTSYWGAEVELSSSDNDDDESNDGSRSWRSRAGQEDPMVRLGLAALTSKLCSEDLEG